MRGPVDARALAAARLWPAPKGSSPAPLGSGPEGSSLVRLASGPEGSRARAAQSSTASASAGAVGTRSGCRMCASSSRPSIEPRPRPREVRRRVDRDDPLRAERAQLVRVLLGLDERAGRVVAARHDDDDVGLRRRDELQRRLLRRLAGQAGHVLAARHLDELRRPVPGDEDRVQPLERHDARAPRSAHREADDVRAPGGAGDEVQRRVLRARRLRRSCARRRASRRRSSGPARSRAAARAA